VFGIAGTAVSEQKSRAVFWGIDGVGIVVAASILALKILEKAERLCRRGFLVFAIAESIILSRPVFS